MEHGPFIDDLPHKLRVIFIELVTVCEFTRGYGATSQPFNAFRQRYVAKAQAGQSASGMKRPSLWTGQGSKSDCCCFFFYLIFIIFTVLVLLSLIFLCFFFFFLLFFFFFFFLLVVVFRIAPLSSPEFPLPEDNLANFPSDL